MSLTAAEYVTQTPEGGWRLSGSRVSLDSIVHAYSEGMTPESIADEFESLSVEQFYGATAFYLHNQEKIDAYLSQQNSRWESLQGRSRVQHGRLINRMMNARGAEPGSK